MTDRADIIIHGGVVIDGTGAEPLEADVAITDGRIVAVGRNLGPADETIDAKGRIVTPGFVDIHTHYDGQVTWDNRLMPSAAHGVTTAVIGNCGIGFAPCHPDDRERLIRLMEGVEDLPEIVLTTGLPWTWETFPNYLDLIASRSYDIDVAALLPHAAVRVYAMGQRAVDREPANAADRALMARVARGAVEAGAIGFATSRTINHRSSDGKQVPTLDATEDELTAIAMALKDAGRGVLQLITDFNDVEADCAMLRRIVAASGRPLSLTLLQLHDQPEKWRRILAWIDGCQADHLPVRGQVSGRSIGIFLGFELSFNPFMHGAAWQTLVALPVDDRLRALRDPDMRARILAETPGDSPFEHMLRNFSNIFALGERPDYEPSAETSIAAEAARSGVNPEALAYDRMLEQDGRGILMWPSTNYADRHLGPQLEMLRNPHTLCGLGDAGAHLGFLCDASLPTFLLQHWVRDRAGERLPLVEMVRKLTSANAKAMGLLDRGVIRPGWKADLNVIDFDRLNLKSPRVAYDLPAGGRRLVQDAEGYDATIVSGAVTYREGVATENLPGRLVRGQQGAPG